MSVGSMTALEYWKNRPLEDLHWAVTIMALDTNAFTPSDRRAVLQVMSLLLEKLTSRGEKEWNPTS